MNKHSGKKYRLGLIMLLIVTMNVGFAQSMQLQRAAYSVVKLNGSGKKVTRLSVDMRGTYNPLSVVSIRLARNRMDTAIRVYYSQDSLFETATELSIRQDLHTDLQVIRSPLLSGGDNFFWFVTRGGIPPSITGFTLGKRVYRQAWSDDFNADTLNRQNWDFEKGFVRNQELQWYQEENAVCKNGVLRIEARREHKPNPLYITGSLDWRTKAPFIEYTSASIHTSGKRQWLYGRMEMRARIDTASGYWPAWWTLGSNKPWPSNGEIDMMEFYRGKVLANIAVGTPKPFDPIWFSNTWPVRLGGKNWMGAFHTWRMDWDAYGISVYLDGQLLNFQPQNNLYNRDGSEYYPFRHPQYMLLNLAIGGMNGGDPSRSTFPLAYEIDYVKVLQATDDTYADTRFFTPDTSR